MIDSHNWLQVEGLCWHIAITLASSQPSSSTSFSVGVTRVTETTIEISFNKHVPHQNWVVSCEENERNDTELLFQVCHASIVVTTPPPPPSST